jgi:EAL domain-containing protein (putative c-di-GMP-specific phosphodiesterase class I)
MVRSAIDAGVPPRLISFEITETSASTNLDAAAAFAAELHELGCELALDDFGTGFGSFLYLHRLRVDTIKIDMEFVRELTRRGPDYHLVESLVRLAHRLGQTTVAEGVEDEETMVLLGELGVDYAQGYHLGRPAPLQFGSPAQLAAA